jgi:hypothetical protein
MKSGIKAGIAGPTSPIEIAAEENVGCSPRGRVLNSWTKMIARAIQELLQPAVRLLS